MSKTHYAIRGLDSAHDYKYKSICRKESNVETSQFPADVDCKHCIAHVDFPTLTK
jgi:hypothetical protein